MEVKTPVRDELIAALSDSTTSPARRKLAADILEWYAKFNIPSESDKEIVAVLADFNADLFWSGSDTMDEYQARNHR